MAADLTNRHPARIHRNDLVVEIGKPALILGDQLRIESPGTIPRHRKGHLRTAGQHRLLRIAVPPIAFPVGLTLIVEVLVKFGVQNALRQRLLEFVNQTVLVENVLRIAASQKLVQ